MAESTSSTTSGTAYPVRAASSSEADKLVVEVHRARMAAPRSEIGKRSPAAVRTRSTAHKTSSPLGVSPCPAPSRRPAPRHTSSRSPQKAALHTAAAWSTSSGELAWQDSMSANSANSRGCGISGAVPTRAGRHSRTSRTRQPGSRISARPAAIVSPGLTPQTSSRLGADRRTAVGSINASEATTGRTSWCPPIARYSAVGKLARTTPWRTGPVSMARVNGEKAPGT
jgi:hypothetical protein